MDMEEGGFANRHRAENGAIDLDMVHLCRYWTANGASASSEILSLGLPNVCTVTLFAVWHYVLSFDTFSIHFLNLGSTLFECDKSFVRFAG